MVNDQPLKVTSASPTINSKGQTELYFSGHEHNSKEQDLRLKMMSPDGTVEKCLLHYKKCCLVSLSRAPKFEIPGKTPISKRKQNTSNADKRQVQVIEDGGNKISYLSTRYQTTSFTQLAYSTLDRYKLLMDFVRNVYEECVRNQEKTISRKFCGSPKPVDLLI